MKSQKAPAQNSIASESGKPDAARMRRFWTGTLALLVGIILLSSLAAYPAWLLAEALAPDRWHFQRVFNRVLMLSTFALLPVLAAAWKVRWRDIGLHAPVGPAVRTALLWFFAGAGMIGVLALWGALWGFREPRFALTLSRAVGHLASGLAIGVAEEAIFRGFFFLAAWRLLAPRAPVQIALAGSAVFASVHFFIEVRGLPAEPGWGTGATLWIEWGRLLLSPEPLLTRWLALFLAGLLLCAVAARQGHIWGAVALHAGWVFAIKTVHRLSRSSGGDSLWFSSDLLSGLWASCLLALVLLALLRRPRPATAP
jgi:membrane protease YdiL (CAAX protease family)